MYSVSPYLEMSVSVNIHLAIYERDTICFAPSLQLIDTSEYRLEYCGSDYSAFNLLSDLTKQRIFEESKAVGKRLSAFGYRGICGIDFIVSNDLVYFCEINPRFQASSALLNQNLEQCGFASLQAYHIDSFFHPCSTLSIPPYEATGSFYNFTMKHKKATQLRWIIHILTYLKEKENSKPIYLMNLPITDEGLFFQLVQLGLSEVAYNIEVFDRELAKVIMPGKGKIPLTDYMQAFRIATKYLGMGGAVRSIMIVGLEAESTLYNGVEWLCGLGVAPILSVFRPAKGTPWSTLRRTARWYATTFRPSSCSTRCDTCAAGIQSRT